MNKLSLTIEQLQHIVKLEFSIDLTTPGLMVIVGKNGVGKTILFKAIQNLITSNTFANTSNRYIYNDDSKIIYEIDDDSIKYEFTYNNQVETLDIKGEVDLNIVNQIFVELPIPFGERFQQFKKLGTKDKAIRTAIITESYGVPHELIESLNYIYDNNKFDNLVEITIKKEKFYAIKLKDSFYIREDYLSSGEFFIINIFKYIKQGKKLIAIDEIDISLDSMAQVRFADKLRDLASKYELKLLFSTHSLALIKTLKKDELFYMDLKDGISTYEKKSYNYIKSLLYGFNNYDKYILTEDEVLKNFIKYLLDKTNIFSKFIVIPIAGSSNTVELMNINKDKHIFGLKQHVLTVLDGDMKDKSTYKGNEYICFSPFYDIEDAVLVSFNNNEFGCFSTEDLKNPKKYNVQRNPEHKDYSKSIYKMLLKHKVISEHQIFEHLISQNTDDVEIFKKQLISFLDT